MGAWGVAIFSDDLATDVRDDFRDLIGEGLSATQAVDKLLVEYASSANDVDEESVFWIALALTQWKLGRLEARSKEQALRMIESGQDLRRWQDTKLNKKRIAVLEEARQQLLSPPPSPKKVRRAIKNANDWLVGEVIGFQLRSGQWALFRTVGAHVDKGGRFAVCEVLDWCGAEIPSAEAIAALPVKQFNARWDRGSQFMFCDPRVKRDQMRLQRPGIFSTPAQKCGGYRVILWSKLDAFLEASYGLA